MGKPEGFSTSHRGNQLYSTLYGVCTEMLHHLMVILEGNATKGEAAKFTFIEPLSKEKFREQRQRKRKSSDDTDKRARNPAESEEDRIVAITKIVLKLKKQNGYVECRQTKL
jgi:hypothetical protein